MQERILVYGGTGSGKSTGWLTIARQQPDNTFYCIDTDKSVARLLGTEFKDVKNVKIFPCRTWQVCDKTITPLIPTIKENDWLIIDMLDSFWDFVQSWYTQQAFNKDIEDYFLQLRKSIGGGSKLEAFKGWTDWQIINKVYQSLVNPVMYDYDYNIYATAKSRKYVAADEDEPTLKEAFSAVGYEPDGEKRNPYRVHTILYLNHDINGYYATTIKDRGRQQLREFPYTNFADMYSKVIKDEKLVATPNESRDNYNKEQQYKTFGKWLDKNHVRWTEAREILGIGENDEIVNYHEAMEKIKKVKGIIS